MSVKYKSNHKGITIHVDENELIIYNSLTYEQKATIRALVKMILRNPQLLQTVSTYLTQLASVKAISEYVCPLCLIPFSSRNALLNHIRYTNHELKCRVCNKEFNKQDALLDHLCKKHNICIS